jgi:hypothetical protein
MPFRALILALERRVRDDATSVAIEVGLRGLRAASAILIPQSAGFSGIMTQTPQEFIATLRIFHKQKTPALRAGRSWRWTPQEGFNVDI